MLNVLRIPASPESFLTASSLNPKEQTVALSMAHAKKQEAAGFLRQRNKQTFFHECLKLYRDREWQILL